MDKLENPIFIKENIIRPMFNEEQENNIIELVKWFGEYCNDKILVKAILDTLNELLEINEPLLRLYSDYTDYDCIAKEEFLTDFGRDYLLCIFRGIMMSQKNEDDTKLFRVNEQKIDDLYHFFAHLYSHNNSIGYYRDFIE